MDDRGGINNMCFRLERDVERLNLYLSSQEQECRGFVPLYPRQHYPPPTSYSQHPQQAQQPHQAQYFHQAQQSHQANHAPAQRQAGVPSSGRGAAGHLQLPAGGGNGGQQAQGRPVIRAARSHPTLASFLGL